MITANAISLNRVSAQLPQLARLSVLALVIALLAACGGGKQAGAPQGPPPTPVNVAEVVTKDVTQWDEFTGRVEAVESVEIRPRVTGYLQKINFREGGEVKKGDVLFEIDDREYRAAYEHAQADIARAQSRLELSKRQLARFERLLGGKAISQDEVDIRNAEMHQAEADVRATQAAAAQARLNVDFSKITSPIDGRVSRANVTVGNLVTNGLPQSTLMTNVVSMDKVYVYFNGDEQVYLKYQQMSKAGERASSRDAPNPVRMGLANETGFPHEGHMDFVDNQFDSNTGTIRGRAVFDNAERLFTPGLFARMQLLGSGTHSAMLIHDRAVLTDQDRRFVYVIGPENKALRKDVKLGVQVDGLRVVASGLDPKDKVVVNGVAKIFFPGMPVAPNVVPMDQPDLPPPQTAEAKPAPNATAGK